EGVGGIFSGEVEGDVWKKLVGREVVLGDGFGIMGGDWDVGGVMNVLGYGRSVCLVGKGMYR
ncbi:hypothetical protein, partial [Kocuria rosea]|uniref:hypothetical protein n=1 Tax=Kocuria rosea TaxID=1275 RepID=UPI001C92EA6D